MSWLGYIKWASWPRCYVASLFDRPNTEPPVPALVPVADWSRVRIVLNGEPQLLRHGEMLSGLRTLDRLTYAADCSRSAIKNSPTGTTQPHGLSLASIR